jgi:ribosomal protein S18 acetylase RimI-like enzyme
VTAPSTIRQLVAADAATFRDIRLEGLRTAPEAFGSSYEAEAGMSDAEIAKWIGNGYIAGARIDGKLIGVAGFFVESGAKSAHRGRIWGVYVRPAARGRGVAGALLEHLIAHARPLVEQVHLSVVTENAAAVALYRRLGFTTYGTEPRALRIGERYFDEYLMVLRLG